MHFIRGTPSDRAMGCQPDRAPSRHIDITRAKFAFPVFPPFEGKKFALATPPQ